MGPAGGPADGAGVARRIDERFDQHGAQVERADLVEVDPTGTSPAPNDPASASAPERHTP